MTIFSGHDVTILGLLFILGAKEVEVDPHTLDPDTFLLDNNVKGNRPGFFWPYYGMMYSDSLRPNNSLAIYSVQLMHHIQYTYVHLHRMNFLFLQAAT